MSSNPPLLPRREHLTRLRDLWRSAGWPSRDSIEIDLLAAGWVAPRTSDGGHETLHLTEAGIQLLARARQSGRRALSAHDRLAERFAAHLANSGRIVWRELPLRAAVAAPVPDDSRQAANEALWQFEAHDGDEKTPAAKIAWRIARPDLFSVRNTTVEGYLRPMVHEVKVSRADLLSDLRHAAKRQSYEWLCCECYYVLAADIAQPHEIPPEWGVWMLLGPVDEGRLELLRPARHSPCTLPFAVWMALAKATPAHGDGDEVQALLGERPDATTTPAMEAAFGPPSEGQAEA
jgi:hypothetical protein